LTISYTDDGFAADDEANSEGVDITVEEFSAGILQTDLEEDIIDAICTGDNCGDEKKDNKN